MTSSITITSSNPLVNTASNGLGEHPGSSDTPRNISKPVTPFASVQVGGSQQVAIR